MEATKLNEVQKSLLRMFARGMSEEETLELKRLLTRHYAQKAREEANRVAAEKGYTQADYDAVLNRQTPRKTRHQPGPGVTVVENLPKAKLSPSLRAQVEEARQFLERAGLPEGWNRAEHPDNTEP